ncbi:MAG TPA: hypothetical protein VH459_10610 [Gaiellales bacterium]|jgi:hypothetical protein
MPRIAVALLAVLSAMAAPAPAGAALFHDAFTVRDGLLTNEYRYWNHLPSRDARWQMTSGSLFARGRAGWTGHPDGCASASKRGRPCNASDVFRLNTRAHRFGNVTVGFDLKNLRLTSSDRTPPEDWDGVHVWLHYQSEFELYYASFDRRDGRIVVKKKCAGGSTNGGTYYELGPGELPGFPIRFGRWKYISAAIRNNADGSVTITMRRNGRRLLRVSDSGVGCAPITASGAVGIRGDNDEFRFDNFTVTASR